MKAVNLRTEYLKDPIGVDFRNPRLMWNCEGGIIQTAYQICTGNFDSGKVMSSSMHAVYSEPLDDRQIINWKVRLWDENDEPGEWTAAHFETGISSWRAKWISGNYKVDRNLRYPVDCFRREINISKPVAKARLYITACGLYEARLNDEKIGTFCLAPGITDYRKRVQYQTYDVTEMLKSGQNVLSVQLADGWYRGSVGAWGLRNQYGTETKLLAQLEISYADGQKETIATDETWDWSDDGPIRFADNKDGEIIEAFRTPHYSAKAKVTEHSVIPTASNNVSVTEHERFHPLVTVSPNGRKLFDFGQNIAGYLSFKVNAGQGDRIVWRFGEMLDDDGNLTLKNIQCVNKKGTSPLQRIEYTCREGLNEYKTTFAVFGFRYAEADTDLELNPDDIEAIAVYSDMEETGEFESSNELLNQFVRCTKWSAKSNSLDIPTDCPTRERHGWTGDAQIFFETAGYLFDYAAFAKKYLNDVFDWQRKDGCLPQIAPYGGVDFYMNPMNGSVGWSDIGILIPWRFSKLYNDPQILEEYYDRMKKYADFMISRCGKNGLLAKNLHLSGEAKKYAVNKGQSYGEWAEPEDVHPNDWRDMAAPHPEESTAYTAYVIGLMAKIAEKTGHSEDAEYYGAISEKCKKAYQALSEKPDFTLDTDRQARLVRPLAFDLLNDEQKQFAQNRLVQAMENYGWRLGTGFLSTPLILDVLEQIDIEMAYRLLENEEMPGWLFMPKNGATTIWESWEGTQAQSGIASLNHYSKGAVCEWLFRSMCGINIDGENHFCITPQHGGHFTYAEASCQSIFGKVVSGWKIENGETVYHISVPSNCTALIKLPGKEPETVSAGEYTFKGERK